MGHGSTVPTSKIVTKKCVYHLKLEYPVCPAQRGECKDYSKLISWKIYTITAKCSKASWMNEKLQKNVNNNVIYIKPDYFDPQNSFLPEIK